jgi:hypothetical protein
MIMFPIILAEPKFGDHLFKEWLKFGHIPYIRVIVTWIA